MSKGFDPFSQLKDMLPENRIAGIPPHDPPPELEEYFSTSGALNGHGLAVFATKNSKKGELQWWESEPGQSLGLYLWKVGGGSSQVIQEMTGTTVALARSIKKRAQKIAEVRGFYEKKADGCVMYVEVEPQKLGESMLGTLSKLHDELVGRIPTMEPKELESAIKTLSTVSMLLQGKPTGRTATINEKPHDERQLLKDFKAFKEVVERIDKKKDFKPANEKPA
jgi:hypothetical protein